MTTDELTAIQDRGNGIARTARKAYRCRCADEVKWYRAKLTTTHGTTTMGRYTEADAKAVVDKKIGTVAHWNMNKTPPEPSGYYLSGEVEVVRNPNYRPDCLGDINPGDRYFENFDDSPAYQSGARYCRVCALALWSKPNDQPPVNGLRELLSF